MHTDPYPRWRDGEPANLTAAAMDALLWLRTLRTIAAMPIIRTGLPPHLQRQTTIRLDRAIACLTSYTERAIRRRARRWRWSVSTVRMS